LPEIETKIADININELKRQFRIHKVKFVEKVLMRRWVFVITQKKGEESFIRIRTDGKKSSLTYKHRKGRGLRNTKEVETSIKDFDKAAFIISKIIKEKYYQENRREIYSYKGLEIDINYWPKVSPFMEIEGPSARQIYKFIKELKIKGKLLGNVSMVNLYRYYNKDLHSYKILKL
jgi:adenylate cyclase class 2